MLNELKEYERKLKNYDNIIQKNQENFEREISSLKNELNKEISEHEHTKKKLRERDD